MTIGTYGTYIGIASAIAFLISGLDHIFPTALKKSCGKAVSKLLQACSNPFSVHGYVFVLGNSLFLTIIISLLTGVWVQLFEDGKMFSLPIKSAAPLIAGITFKILFVDYALALKSYQVMRITKIEHARTLAEEGKATSLTKILFAVAIFDILFSCTITDLILRQLEITSLQNMLGDTADLKKYVPDSIFNFFDEVNFSIQNSIKRAIFVLNGTIVFYFGSLFTAPILNSDGFVDWDSVHEKPFTIISYSFMGLCLVVLTSIALAYR
ncbi:hypothetical protein P4E94_08885 [Pontiellaceae bacterium B12219]|nr:hypothetical protein [Pontiellaceae bacterium B12219]